MTLPNTSITPIPDNEPDAVPSLWNERYDEIDENFENLDERLSGKESEIVSARGSKDTLDERLDEIEENVEGLDPDMQNTLMATVMAAVDAAGLANRELDRLKNVLIQEGEVTILNRGIISGCSISKSDNATRNLNLAAGKPFVHGRTYSANELLNTAAVPANNTAAAAICYAYLFTDENGDIQCDCTSLGEAVPENGIEIYSMSVPAGNNETTDPYLANVTLTDTRRLEPNWPGMFENPAFVYVPLANILPDSDYTVDTEVISLEGGRQQAGELLVEDRLKNGFKFYLAGAADTVVVRYAATRLKA
jgi:hypothetical protein